MCQCTCWMIFTSVVGIVFYLFDVGTDIANGIIFILRGDVHWGLATIIFVVLPAAIYIFLLLVYGLSRCCCCDNNQHNNRYSTTQRLRKIPYWKSTIVWVKPEGLLLPLFC